MPIDVHAHYVPAGVRVDRMVIGTDESFPPHEADPLGLLRRAQFSEEEIAAIGDGNPRALFKLPD